MIDPLAGQQPSDRPLVSGTHRALPMLIVAAHVAALLYAGFVSEQGVAAVIGVLTVSAISVPLLLWLVFRRDRCRVCSNRLQRLTRPMPGRPDRLQVVASCAHCRVYEVLHDYDPDD